MRSSPRPNSLCVAAVVAALFATSFSVAPAAESRRFGSAGTHRPDAREQLLYIAGEYREIVATNRFGPGLDTLLDRVSETVGAMTDEESARVAEQFSPLIDRMLVDLGTLKAAFARRLPVAPQIPRDATFPDAEYPAVNLGDLILTVSSTDLPSLDELLNLINPLNGGAPPGIPQVPNSIIPGKCYGDPDGDGVANRTADSVLLYSKIGIQGLELTNAVAKDVCGQDLGALGFTGNLSVVCILFDVAYLVPRFLYDNVQECEGFIDGAEATASYKRLGFLHDEMGEVKTTLAGLDATVVGGFDAVNAKLDVADGKLDAISGKEDVILAALAAQRDFLVEFKKLAVRMEIEQSLTANGVDKVSLFQLPEAYGGYLEVVRRIVGETIQNTRAAGLPVYNAQREFDRGNDAFRTGAYKTAYEQYRKAYVEAVK